MGCRCRQLEIFVAVFAVSAIGSIQLSAQSADQSTISHFMQEEGYLYLSGVRDLIDNSIKVTLAAGHLVGETGIRQVTPMLDPNSQKALDDLEDHIGINTQSKADQGYFFMLKLIRKLARTKYSEWYRLNTRPVVGNSYITAVEMPINAASADMYDICLAQARADAKSARFDVGNCTMDRINAAIKADAELNSTKVVQQSERNKTKK